MTLPVRSEDAEQAEVVRFCDLHFIPRFRVPNETYTKSGIQRGKNKRLGVSPGVPDLFCIPGNKLIAIEMKRVSGSKTSDLQRLWIDRLNAAGVPTRICKGAGEAIEFIKSFLPKQPTPKDDDTLF